MGILKLKKSEQSVETLMRELEILSMDEKQMLKYIEEATSDELREVLGKVKHIKERIKQENEEIDTKIQEISYEIEKIKGNAQQEIKESFEQEPKEPVISEDDKKLKKAIDERKERIGHVNTVSGQLWHQANMIPDLDKDAGLFWSEVQEVMVKIRETEDPKKLEKLHKELIAVNSEFRKKYPYLLPTEEALKDIEDKSKKLLKQITDILSDNTKLKYLMIIEDGMYTKKDTLDGIKRHLENWLQDVRENCKNLMMKHEERKDTFDLIERKVAESKRKEEEEKKKREEQEKEAEQKKESGEKQQQPKELSKKDKKALKKKEKELKKMLKKQEKAGETRETIEDLEDKMKWILSKMDEKGKTMDIAEKRLDEME